MKICIYISTHSKLPIHFDQLIISFWCANTRYYRGLYNGIIPQPFDSPLTKIIDLFFKLFFYKCLNDRMLWFFRHRARKLSVVYRHDCDWLLIRKAHVHIIKLNEALCEIFEIELFVADMKVKFLIRKTNSLPFESQ